MSVKLGWYIGSISSINSMNFQVPTLNVMVTVRQNNSSIHPTFFILLFIATISQDLFNPCLWMFRPRIRLMGHPMPQLRAKADLPVGFPYRFNSSFLNVFSYSCNDIIYLHNVVNYWQCDWPQPNYSYNTNRSKIEYSMSSMVLKMSVLLSFLVEYSCIQVYEKKKVIDHDSVL